MIERRIVGECRALELIEQHLSRSTATCLLGLIEPAILQDTDLAQSSLIAPGVLDGVLQHGRRRDQERSDQDDDTGALRVPKTPAFADQENDDADQYDQGDEACPGIEILRQAGYHTGQRPIDVKAAIVGAIEKK